MLAIYAACMKWRCYLQGTSSVVHTDHEPLKYLHTQPNLNPRQVRWMERLGQLDVEIQYKPGVTNTAADALSRLPQYTTAAAEQE